MNKKNASACGFFLLEAILAASLIALLITGVVFAILIATDGQQTAGNRNRAVLFAEAGLEVVRNIRDADFSNLTAGDFGLSITENGWELTGTSDTFGEFSRTITISDISSGQKQITATIRWPDPRQGQQELILETVLNNWQ